MPLSRLFPASRAQAMHDYMRRFAAQFGVANMRFSDWLPNTRRALAMAELARDHGRFDDFHDAAMSAYWVDGRNLEDDEVLRDLARQHGLEPEAALEATRDPRYLDRIDAIRDEAESLGVTGIPTCFIGKRRVIGCQPYEAFAEAVRQAGGQPRA